MSFDGLAGLHCLVIPALVKIPYVVKSDGIMPQSSVIDFWIQPTLDQIDQVFQVARQTLDYTKIVSNPLDDELKDIFDVYCTTLYPWSRIPSSSPFPSQDEVSEQAGQIKHLFSTFGGNLKLRARLRDVNDGPNGLFMTGTTQPLTSTGAISEFTDPVIAYVDNAHVFTKTQAQSLSNIPKLGQGLLESLVTKNPFLIPSHLPSCANYQWRTVLSMYVIPLGSLPPPKNAGDQVDEAESRWKSFCTNVWKKRSFRWPDVSNVGWEFLIDRPAVPIPSGPEYTTSLVRFASIPIVVNQQTPSRKFYVKFNNIGDLYNFVESQINDARDNYDASNEDYDYEAMMDLTLQMGRLRENAHNALFCTRLPTTMWNHLLPLPVQNMFGVENITPTSSLAASVGGNDPNVLGKGHYGTVVSVEWVYDANKNRGFDQRNQLVPGVENMAVIHELANFIKTANSCMVVRRVGGGKSDGYELVVDQAKLLDMVQKSNVSSMSLDVNIVVKRNGPVRNLLLPVILMIEPNGKISSETLSRFYVSSISFAEAVVDIMTRSEVVKYDKVTNDGIFNVSKALVRAYTKHMTGSWSAVAEYIEEIGYPSKILAILKSTANVIDSGRARVVLHTHMVAALKIGTNPNAHFLWECSLMQFFAAYKLSPSSIPGIYERISAFFPGLGNSAPATISRNDISNGVIYSPKDGRSILLRNNYLSAVHPEDRLLNPKATIRSVLLEEGATDELGMEMVFDDDRGNVIAVVTGIEPMNELMLDLEPFRRMKLFGVGEVLKIPPPCIGSTMPVYGSTLTRRSNVDEFAPPSIESITTDIMIMPKMPNGSLGQAIYGFGSAIFEISGRGTGFTTMDQVYPGQSMSLVKIIEAFADMAGALAFINNHGVSHMDFKPSNVVMDVDYKAYLTDFGMSSAYGTIATVGTRLYLPDYYENNGETVVRDSMFDCVMLGNSILESLFAAHPKSVLGQWLSTIDLLERQDGSRRDLSHEMKLSAEKHIKAGYSNPFLFDPTLLSFSGMIVGEESVAWYMERWGVEPSPEVQQQSEILARLAVGQGVDIANDPKSVPIHPLLTEYIVEQMLEIGRHLRSMTFEQMKGSSVVDDESTQIPTLDDPTTHGFSTEWYVLPQEMRRSYGFMNRLKVAETHMRWLLELISRDQLSSFEALQVAFTSAV